jgi:hypothetical protein
MEPMDCYDSQWGIRANRCFCPCTHILRLKIRYCLSMKSAIRGGSAIGRKATVLTQRTIRLHSNAIGDNYVFTGKSFKYQTTLEQGQVGRTEATHHLNFVKSGLSGSDFN